MRSSLSAFGLTAFSLTAFALNCVQLNCVRANCVCLASMERGRVAVCSNMYARFGTLLATITFAAFKAYARGAQPGVHVLGTLMPEKPEDALRAELQSARAAETRLLKQLAVIAFGAAAQSDLPRIASSHADFADAVFTMTAKSELEEARAELKEALAELEEHERLAAQCTDREAELQAEIERLRTALSTQQTNREKHTNKLTTPLLTTRHRREKVDHRRVEGQTDQPPLLSQSLPPADRDARAEPPRRSSRRVTLTTPVPTPLIPLPTPSTPIPTTTVPSAMPSTSPVPTTVGITTYPQLRNVIDAGSSDVVVEGDGIFFPSQAPITIESGRTVSIVGSGSASGGLMRLNAQYHSRHFMVYGTLSLTSLSFVNGTAPDPSSVCSFTFDQCKGGNILVFEGGALSMSSCEFIDGGRAETAFGGAYEGAGIYLGAGSIADISNSLFTDLIAYYGGAISNYRARLVIRDSIFLRNKVYSVGGGSAISMTSTEGGEIDLYGCLFEHNIMGAI